MSFTPAGLISIAALIPSILFMAAGLHAMLGLYGWRHRGLPAVTPFIWINVAMACWSLGYGLEIVSNPLSQKILWAKFQYLGIVTIPVAWFIFALEYTGRKAWARLRNVSLLSIVPIAILSLVWTNELHGLIWEAITPLEESGLSLLDFSRGPLYLFNVAYSYILLLFGSVMAAMGAWRTPRIYRSQIIAMLVAACTPWAMNFIHIAGLHPIPSLDITPLSFLPTAFALAWAITRYHILDLVPPQQNAILQSLDDGVVVLDARRRVLYMNRAAEDILSVNADEALGQSAEMVCSVCSPVILPLLGREEVATELTLNGAQVQRHLEVRIFPNYFSETSRRGEPNSHLLIFHDITGKKQAQEALKYREAILQAVSLASEQFLKSDAWERNIPGVLERLGEAAAVSRVYIFERRISESGVPVVSQRYEWVRTGVEPQIDNPDLQDLEWVTAGFARWEETLGRRGIISGLVKDFPESERDLLAAQNILSIVIMPVFVENGFWGFVGFDECDVERHWSKPELEALQAAADIFGAALTRRKAETRLLERQRTLDLLHQIIQASLGSPDFETMARVLVADLTGLIHADTCFFTLWDPVHRRTIPVAASTSSPARDSYRDTTILPGETTFTESVMKVGHTLVVEDVTHSPYISPRLNVPNVTSALVVPLLVEGNGMGAMIFAFNQPHKFSQKEINIAEEASSLVSLALAKFQAVEEARHHAEEAEMLRRAGLAISETLNLKEATTNLLEQLAFVLPHDSASVQLLRDGELEIIGGEGWRDPSTVIGVRFPVPSDNPNTVVIETGKPYILNEPGDFYPAFRTTPHAAHIRSWLGVPLMVHNRIIGLLAIDSRTPQRFTPADAELASTFAAQVAIAIENARLFDEVERLAITDGLTGLYNRRHFMKLAQVEFDRACRYRHPLSAMIFDIDHFKSINDTFGHPVGDRVLIAIARLAREILRETDPIGRYGGEEFVALVMEAAPSAAKQAGERLRKKAEELKIETEKGPVSVTISVGIAAIGDYTSNLETLINRADQAMYVAKHKGRNRVIMGK